MFTWNVDPLVGLGPLKIGMSRADVASLLDHIHAVTYSHLEFDGSLCEARGLYLPMCTFVSERVQAIEVNHRVKNVIFRNNDVFMIKSRDLISQLDQNNGGTQYAFGILLFYKLSVSIGGFYDSKRGFYGETFDGWQDERTLTVSAEHAFQALLPNFKKINPLRRKK